MAYMHNQFKSILVLNLGILACLNNTTTTECTSKILEDSLSPRKDENIIVFLVECIKTQFRFLQRPHFRVEKIKTISPGNIRADKPMSQLMNVFF